MQIVKLCLKLCREELSRWAQPLVLHYLCSTVSFCLAAQLFAFLGCVNGEYRQGPGNLLEGRVFFSQSKLSALYTGTCICLMISIFVIERAVKKHRERDGGYQGYWIWWNQVFCSSMFPGSGWTNSRHLQSQDQFQIMTFSVCMEVRL